MNLGVGAYRDDNNKVRQKSNPPLSQQHTAAQPSSFGDQTRTCHAC
jgi:hypothetical protein